MQYRQKYLYLSTVDGAMRAMAEMNAGDYEFLTSASILAGTALFRLTDRPIIMTECDFHIQKNGQLSPCADKTVI